jgi:hypothetical protein
MGRLKNIRMDINAAGVAGGTRIIVILQTNAFAYELKRQKNSWG